MARGKGADVLSLDELMGEGKEGALVDVVLEPGQVSEHFRGTRVFFSQVWERQNTQYCVYVCVFVSVADRHACL